MSLRAAPRPESRLRQRIADEIRRNGPIPFSRYMEMCLYEPDLGYYSRSREQFGKAGDFYTSSDVHAVFGRLLARQFEEMWRALDSPQRIDVIELGPGRGLFARDVLDWSAKQFPEFSRALHYALVEQSAHLRDRLQERLAEHIAAGKAQRLRVAGSGGVRRQEKISSSSAMNSSTLFRLRWWTIGARCGLTMENGRFVETFDSANRSRSRIPRSLQCSSGRGRAGRSDAGVIGVDGAHRGSISR